MKRYVALLRGINVGGKAIIKMVELRACLEDAGLRQVSTYIQSGNIFFSSQSSDTLLLAQKIERAIKQTFDVSARAVVLSAENVQKIIDEIPAGFGDDPEWKYNVIFLIPPYDMDEVIAGIGQLKPDIETLQPGQGVLYQSMVLKLFGRTTTGKMFSQPVIKQMTVRNLRTTRKLLELVTNTL